MPTPSRLSREGSPQLLFQVFTGIVLVKPCKFCCNYRAVHGGDLPGPCMSLVNCIREQPRNRQKTRRASSSPLLTCRAEKIPPSRVYWGQQGKT